MSRVRSKNTTPEVVVRSMVFSMGYRYRLHDRRLPGKPDLVFPGRRKAIFVNGCYWHGHENCKCARIPKTHVSYWRDKLRKNRRRDRNNVSELMANGWEVLTIWQCELKNPEKLKAKLDVFLK
jgi:DNA mismatch endonuclease (patch repair protein)